MNALDTNIAAGTLTTLSLVGEDNGATAPNDYELDDQGAQLSPVAGYMSLHIAVVDTTAPKHTCQMTVGAIPAKVTKTSALKHSGAETTSTAQIFGNR